jgi:hypothetical protein
MAELKLFGKTIKQILDEERASETPEAKSAQRQKIADNIDAAGAILGRKGRTPSGNIGSRVDFSDEKIAPKFSSPKKITREKTTVEGDLGSVDTSNPDVIGPNMGQVNPVASATPELTGQQQAQNLLSRGYAPGMKRGGKVKAKCGGGKMSSGGKVTRSSASKRGDGCATKGHTKGRYL